jgi:hypothetical protein
MKDLGMAATCQRAFGVRFHLSSPFYHQQWPESQRSLLVRVGLASAEPSRSPSNLLGPRVGDCSHTRASLPTQPSQRGSTRAWSCGRRVTSNPTRRSPRSTPSLPPSTKPSARPADGTAGNTVGLTTNPRERRHQICPRCAGCSGRLKHASGPTLGICGEVLGAQSDDAPLYVTKMLANVNTAARL